MPENPYQTPTAPVAETSRSPRQTFPVQRVLLALVIGPLAAVPSTVAAMLVVSLVERQLLPAATFVDYFGEVVGYAVGGSYVAVLTYGMFVFWVLKRLNAFGFFGVVGAALLPGVLVALLMIMAVGVSKLDKIGFIVVMIWVFSVPVAIVFWGIVVGYVPPGLRRAVMPEHS